MCDGEGNKNRKFLIKNNLFEKKKQEQQQKEEEDEEYLQFCFILNTFNFNLNF
jgi:hypothetical protein